MELKQLPFPSFFARLALAGLTAWAFFLLGCGGTMTSTQTGQAMGLQGQVHGGQQAVAGATVTLYAVTTGGYGAAASTLATTTTLGGGHFSFPAYTCTTLTDANHPDPDIYIVATGGDAGAGANSAIALMAALGPCTAIQSADPFVAVNEVTTVGAVYALAPFIGAGTAGAQISTSTGNVSGLFNAFVTANELVNTGGGGSPGTLVPAATVPTSEIYTLADVIAGCVNSTGSGSPGCTNLFTDATPPGGSAPTNTIDAMLNIARFPGQNVASICALALASAPFQPGIDCTNAPPNDWTISVNYSSGIFSPLFLAIDGSNRIWVVGNATVSVLGNNGAQAGFSPISIAAGPRGIAIDSSGNAWVTIYNNGSGNSVNEYLGADGTNPTTVT
ncbi:MAG TPA: hypothetical protein VLV49_17315, partial [Terriglobales bacterium]|nr:hypothetical protein [Terriglobales bacterium]